MFITFLACLFHFDVVMSFKGRAIYSEIQKNLELGQSTKAIDLMSGGGKICVLAPYNSPSYIQNYLSSIQLRNLCKTPCAI